MSVTIRRGIPFVDSSPIARPRGTTDKHRTTTTNSSSLHHHDSAPSRLLCIPRSFWEGASYQSDREGWWVRALSEELTSKCGKCKRIWPAHQLAKDRCTSCKANTLQRQASPKKKKGAKTKLQQTLGLGPSGGNRENIPPQSYFRLHSHIAPHPKLFGGYDAGNSHVGG